MGCGCGRNQGFKGGASPGSRFGGTLHAASRELPAPVLRQIAHRQHVDQAAKREKQRQMKMVRQKAIQNKLDIRAEKNR